VTPLSKSRLLAFRQCPKRLWLDAHMPELLQTADSTQARYAAGHRLGEVARQIFDPSGKGFTFDVMAQGTAGAVAQTQLEIARTSRTLAHRRPLFEAGFEAAGARVFVDVLLPVPTPRKLPQRWGIVEVKSATSLKDVYLDDAAIQYFVATQSGLALDCIAIATVNSDWVLAEKGHYDGLLQQHDVTQDIQNLVMEVPHWVKAAQAVLKRRTPPAVKTGAQCASPYTCAYVAHCQSQEPVVENPVQWLPRVQTKALRAHLAQPAVRGMEDVPDVLLNPQQLRVKQATLRGRAWRDSRGAAQALAAHTAPFYFLDFETLADAVPRWVGARPYQQIPFQFSLHRVGPRGGERHFGFLDISGKDPRLALAKALVAACDDGGAVFAYNARFEAKCLEELAKHLAAKAPARRKLAKALFSIVDRLVDLEPVVRAHYYHPNQKGSWSLKAVLPALLPKLSYADLDGVQNGTEAQLAYAEAVDDQTPLQRVRELHQQLLAYCELDTRALVELWRFLK
jgi:hypothetical protein